MYKTILASAVVLASTALAAAPGSAIVINGCNYDVQLDAVPAQFGGQTSTSQVLKPNDTFTQQWTELTNGAGWSIKLAKEAGATSIMQYEYTFQNDGTIWYDLSCVDGNPWDGNWEITASGDKACSPKQSAYRYATDDAYGMQSCASHATLTVTLCSGESQNDGLVSAVAAIQSAGATLVASSTTSTITPAKTTTTSPVVVVTSTTKGHAAGYVSAHWYNAVKAANPTTLTTATSTTLHTAVAAAVEHDGDDTVVVYETIVETAIAYETYVPGKRHVHHPEHPDFL